MLKYKKRPILLFFFKTYYYIRGIPGIYGLERLAKRLRADECHYWFLRSSLDFGKVKFDDLLVKKYG